MTSHASNQSSQQGTDTPMVEPNLTDKAAIVTGGSQGLGYAIAQRFVQAGASLLICAREPQQLAEAIAHLRQQRIHPAQQILAVVADVGLQVDVDRICCTALEGFGRLDILVNNAGIQGPFGSIEDIDWQEWFRTIEVNLLGSVLMARAVVPVMKSQRSGKILQISGGGATSPMPFNSAYAVSKAAIVRFVETLAQELQGTGIEVNALAPGALNTRMLDQVLAAGAEKVGSVIFNKALAQQSAGGACVQEASALALFLASTGSDGLSGRLFSAVWDNWRTLEARKHLIAASDVYTLRRVTARDRALDWGDR